MNKGLRLANIVVSIAVLLLAGIIYGWTILSGYIGAEFTDWTSAQLSFTFTLAVACFCLGGLASGLSTKYLNARLKLIVAAIAFFIGFFFGAKSTSYIMLYLTYGVFVGVGSGFAYNAIMTTVPQWMPKNQGFISGMLLMGFGSSSLVVGSAFTAYTSDAVGAWRTSFVALGVITAVIMIAASFIVRLPKVEKTAGKTAISDENVRNYTPIEMVKTLPFWQYFAWVVLVCLVGLAIISQAKNILDILDSGLSTGVIVILAALVSIWNGLGRMIFGAVADRHGWKKAMISVSVLSIIGLAVLIYSIISANVYTMVLGMWAVGATFGGTATMCAVFSKEFFGPKHFAVNFQVVLLNLLISSFGGTIAGVLFDISGSYLSTFITLIVCSTVALFVVLSMRERKIG